MSVHHEFRPFLRFAAAAAIVACCAASSSWAAKLPDWARPIAESAPPVAEGVPKYPYRVLLKETQVTVLEDGTERIVYRLIEQALSSRATEISVGGFVFTDTMKMTSSKAWHVPLGEGAKRSWGSPVDVAIGDAFLSDSKARLIGVKDVKKGSLVFFEFEATDRPRVLMRREYFMEQAPIVTARYALRTPPGWAVQSTWLRTKGPEPAIVGDARTWELKDLDPVEEESLAEKPLDVAPMLVINIVPPEGSKSIAPAIADWNAYAVWYTDLLKGRVDVAPNVAAAAQKAYATSAPYFEKVRGAGRYVRDNVRYVAIELGIGGWQPHPATETLSNLYGDCKDKATLFRAILSAGGVTTYAVPVNLSLKNTVSKEIPDVGAFNHVIAAVPVPSDQSIPPDFATAVVDAGDLGKLLIVDTTDELTPIGSLSADLAGKSALVVAGDKARVVTLPNGEPSTHRLVRKMKMEVQPDRSIMAERTSDYTGDYAWYARSVYRRSSLDRRKGVESSVMRIWPDAAVKDYAVDPETAEGLFVETVKLRVPPPPPNIPEPKLPVFPGASDALDRVSIGKRKTAVVYEYPQTLRWEVTITGLAAGAQIPAPLSQEGDGWKVSSTFERQGEAVHAVWELVLTRTRFEPDAFPELRKLWSAATATSSALVALKG